MLHHLDEICDDAKDWVKIISGSLIALWLTSGVIGLMVAFCNDWDKDKLANLSSFGDWFGVLNSLFSGLALLGAVFAILLQRADIRLTLKEQKEAREATRATPPLRKNSWNYRLSPRSWILDPRTSIRSTKM